MTFFKTIALFGIALAAAACQPKAEHGLITLHGKTMGTTYTVKYIENKQLPDKIQVQQQLDDLLKEVNRQMSTYQPDSEISQFNQQFADAGSREIADDFAAVLAEAIRLNRATEGALDVTVGPLVNLWGFGADKSVQTEPTAAQLNAAAQTVGLDKLVFRQPEHGKKAALGKTVNGVYLDLSAIAKGFGVDKLARHLEQLGADNYLVEIGGELRGKGYNAQGEIWKVGIEQPGLAQQQHSQIIIQLNNQSLATSGDYRNFHVDGQGKRLSHIINPKTRRPISHQLASVSVVADSAMTADGLATGLYVLGETEALRLAELNRWAVFLIIKTERGFEGRMSSEFEKLLARKQ